MSWPRADGESNTELASAGTDRKCKDARNANERDGESDARNSSEDHRIETFRCEHFSANVFECARTFDGLIVSELVNHSRDNRHERLWIAIRMNEKAAASEFLFERMVDCQCRFG